MNNNDLDKELKEKLQSLSHITMPDDSIDKILQVLDLESVSSNRRRWLNRRNLIWLFTSTAAVIAILIGGVSVINTDPRSVIPQNKSGVTQKTDTLSPEGGKTNQEPPNISGTLMPAIVKWDGYTYALTSERIQQPGPQIGQYNGFHLYRLSSTELSQAIAIEVRPGMFFKAVRK